jgi:hypothetical protein
VNEFTPITFRNDADAIGIILDPLDYKRVHQFAQGRRLSAID